MENVIWSVEIPGYVLVPVIIMIRFVWRYVKTMVNHA